ncbi:hypothetical protein TEA_002855 [Camellia sinensis var. sinensis]|uniref:Uncharacterized protein n=1 Tax=Camellia sinensis var. sinensis TaxID=542762 RepID=A0A4S4D5U4_CAMSN|nr:hypothetical protein TEA_002855 [Camellia sinensis var. sinensis]
MPEFQLFFNDHASNDFNTLFTTLPPDRNYFAAGVPDSFYGRFFPKSSIHLMYSSFALHWLSKVPEELLDNGSLAWNKGKIHYTIASKEIADVYAAQFAKDMDTFFNARADEIIDPFRPSFYAFNQSSLDMVKLRIGKEIRPIPGGNNTMARPLLESNSTMARPLSGGNSTMARALTGSNNTMARPLPGGNSTMARPMPGGNNTMARPLPGDNNTMASDEIEEATSSRLDRMEQMTQDMAEAIRQQQQWQQQQQQPPPPPLMPILTPAPGCQS